MSKPVFWEDKRNVITLSSAEFVQRMVTVGEMNFVLQKQRDAYLTCMYQETVLTVILVNYFRLHKKVFLSACFEL